MDNFALPTEFAIGEKEATPHYGYTHAVSYQSGLTVMFNPNRKEMGYHVVMSGATLSTLDHAQVIDWMSSALKITRLDVAVDVKNAGWSKELISTAIAGEKVKTCARHISQWSTLSEAGDTFYFGRKSSTRMTRVYDKGAESGQGGDWWRIETVFKHPHAIQALKSLKDGTATATALIRGHLDIDEDWFKDAMPDDPVLTIAGKPESATKKWLLNQCAPALAKTMYEDGNHGFYLDFVEHVKRLVEELEQDDH